VPQDSRGGCGLRGRHLYAGAFIAAVALLLVPAGASAASPVLEFVVPGHSLPVSFTTESAAVNAEMAGVESLVHCTASHGQGEITGPRSTVSEYRLTGCVTERGSEQKCQSAEAEEEGEIKTDRIEAELVYVDQARHEVGMLLNPGGGTYIAFKCGGVSAVGRGPFLAPVSPINQEATSFTATLAQLDSVQMPDAYENEKDELLQAIPTGSKGPSKFVPTGVEAAFTVHPIVPVEIKAVTVQELEAKQREAEAKKQEEALKKAEEHAKQVAEEAKKHEEELNAQIAAGKKHQEEEAAANKKREEEKKAKSQSAVRAQLLARALRECKKQPKKRRARCVASAHEKYGVRTEKDRLA
jgi:hypothetical protein